MFQELNDDVRGGKKRQWEREFREIWENENKSMFVDVCVRGYKRLDYTHGKHFLTQKKCCIVTQDWIEWFKSGSVVNHGYN